MTDPFLGLKAGGAVAGPVIGGAMRQLEDGEREQIRKSFAQALEWSLASEKERATSAKGGGRRVLRAVRSGLARPAKWGWSRRSKDARSQHRTEVKGKKEIRDAVAMGAADLTRAWTEGPPKIVTNGSNQPAEWTDVLRDCVEKTALEGMAAADEDRAERWRYLVTGSHSPKKAKTRKWATKLVDQVVMLWIRKPRLEGMTAQLNVESGLGLHKTLVVASKSISRSLKWIAFSATTAIVVGGGGIALLVLYLDKG